MEIPKDYLNTQLCTEREINKSLLKKQKLLLLIMVKKSWTINLV